MGESETMVTNAQAEAPGTPPAEGAPETKEATEAVVPPETPTVAAGLMGDESVEDVEKYLRTKYADKGLSENDVDQLVRWRQQGHDGKSAQSQLETSQASVKALEVVAETWGVGKELREMGPAKFIEWAQKGSQPQPKETYGLDPSDPRDKVLIEMRQRLDGMDAEKAKTAQQLEREQQGKNLSDAYAAAIDKGMKDSPDEVKSAMWMLMDSLYKGDAKNIDPTAVTEAFTQAQKMVNGITQKVSTKTKEEIENGKPKVPVIAEETETPGEPNADKDEDPFAAEDRKFIENATRPE